MLKLALAVHVAATLPRPPQPLPSGSGSGVRSRFPLVEVFGLAAMPSLAILKRKAVPGVRPAIRHRAVTYFT